MTEAKRVRVGIVGAGGIVRMRHLPGLTAIPGVEIAAVCNRSRESGESIASEWKIPNVVDDWRSLVERDDVDAVLIGTWPYTHSEMSIAALEAGKHVFCQARMARNAAEARAMLDAANRHPELAAMLCPPPMGMRGDRLMRSLIRAGYLGEPREVHASGLSAANIDPNAPPSWRQDFELQGYNTLTLGMWIEVLHRWMGAHSKVAARVKTFTPSRRDPETGETRNVKIAESVSIAAEFVNGAIASYRFSGVTRNAPPNTIALYGTAGTLVYDLDNEEITGAIVGEKLHAIPIPRDLERDWTVEADFIRAVREGGPTEPSFADGALYMEFTEAVYRSSETGRAIDLPLQPVG